MTLPITPPKDTRAIFKCLSCIHHQSTPVAATAAVTLHFPVCHFGHSLLSSGDKMKSPSGESALQGANASTSISFCQKPEGGGGVQPTDSLPFYISTALIFSRAPHLFCQLSSFREAALLNKAWVIYCAQHWNDAARFSQTLVSWKANVGMDACTKKENQAHDIKDKTKLDCNCQILDFSSDLYDALISTRR